MHYKTLTALTQNPASLSDGVLLVEHFKLRDRLVAGEQPVQFLNELYNLTVAEMVRRQQEEQYMVPRMECDLCRTAVDGDDGKWVFMNTFVCAHCMPQLMRQLV